MCDNPECKGDDIVTYELLQDFCEQDTFCVGSFEDKNFNGQGMLSQSLRYINGLDGKVSHMTIESGGSYTGGGTSCFPGSSEVLKLSPTSDKWAYARMDSIKIGDIVLGSDANGQVSPSKVLSLPHGANKDAATFVEIKTDIHKSMKATPAHLVMVCDECDLCVKPALQSAGSVKVGFCVLTVDVSDLLNVNVKEHKLKPTHVIDVTEVADFGLYTLVTENEYLLVNNFFVSPFEYSHIIPAYYHATRLALNSVAENVMNRLF